MRRPWHRKFIIPSSPQQNILLHIVRTVYPMAQRNYKVRISGMRKSRYPDIAIPHLKVDIEYDGQQHFTEGMRAKDRVRDAELKQTGWRVIRVNKYNWKTFVADIKGFVESGRILKAKGDA